MGMICGAIIFVMFWCVVILSLWFLSQLVEAFTRSEAKVQAWKGGAYSILRGQISGEFVELVSGWYCQFSLLFVS